MIFALTVTGPTYAQSESDDEALALYRRSEESYKQGRYQDAIDLLRKAYALRPEAAFLFNMGRAQERLGDLRQAIVAYSRYLEAEPAATNAADVRRTIARLEHQQAEIEALERRHRAEMEELRRAQSRERAHSEEKTRGAKLVLPKVITAVGGATVLAGGVFVLLARTRESAAEDEAVQANAAHDLDDARRFAAVGTGTLIGGGVLVVTGALWWWLASRGTNAPDPKGAAMRF